ncbi:hypothetical protein N9L49_05920, partial [Rhodospirillales bacterium]|nr:hypothetical protein [Rhodospirillales bacterium]
MQLGKAFGQAILSHGKPEGKTWRVLQPPTGTGKTQGLCVYGAMLAGQNEKLQPEDKTGMLVVTRLITQCDEVVDLINELAGTKVALASHSDNRPNTFEIAAAHVLVITHQAYVNAVKGIKDEVSDKWSNFIDWDYGQRRLVVIDEALANMVEDSQAVSSSVAQTLGVIPEHIKQTYPVPLSALEMVADIFKQMSEMVQGRPDDALTKTKMVWRGTKEMPKSYAMDGLRDALWNQPYDKTVLGKESIPDRHRLRDKVDDTLKSVEAVMANWAYYAKSGDNHTLNFASLVIPDELPGPVVLDATATQNFLWQLFSDRADIYQVPTNARSYANVTLHVARSNGIGKGMMREKHKDRVQRLLANLEAALPAQRKVFLCCHKSVKPYPMTLKPHFERFEIGHWGAIDGRNDWRDCDVAVLFGLSYRNPIWANNTFMAFQGRQEDEWIHNPTFNEYTDVRREMQDRQIAVSIIQAINRVQCRKVIDGDGNCPPTDV